MQTRFFSVVRTDTNVYGARRCNTCLDTLTVPVLRTQAYTLQLVPSNKVAATAEKVLEAMGSPVALGLPITYIEYALFCVRS